MLILLLFEVEESNTKLASYLGLFRLLKLMRCYRIVWVFKYHEQYSRMLSQLQVTLLRNLAYLFFMLHAASCIFWFIARMEGFSADSWVGQGYQQLVDKVRELFDRIKARMDYGS